MFQFPYIPLASNGKIDEKHLTLVQKSPIKGTTRANNVQHHTVTITPNHNNGSNAHLKKDSNMIVVVSPSQGEKPKKEKKTIKTAKKPIKQKRHKFTEEEDKEIKRYVKEYGKNWKAISEQMPHLLPRQIRERYIFYLDPSISNSEWDEKSERMLLDLVETYGTTWTTINAFFPKQSLINIKNQWQKMQRHYQKSEKTLPQFIEEKLVQERVMKAFEEIDYPIFQDYHLFDDDLKLSIDIPQIDISEWFF
ncbi:Myb-like DNA-binding domain containing protein [Tritrichomonas foetus]|uniref:Myb-like DNA-binding domain containing protein n=1 Tax=Tritrichomonas foetus TaxID=1144522 RepID=A0A1J4JXL7_9EUKA|nr:Myb-like DNA-binding domain containing protein [Tritrichomonas foetus]|eukprot:OHT02021.1 Myb-like DNA-binding domain containing protein [Tritrichomonas foetus]